MWLPFCRGFFGIKINPAFDSFYWVTQIMAENALRRGLFSEKAAITHDKGEMRSVNFDF